MHKTASTDKTLAGWRYELRAEIEKVVKNLAENDPPPAQQKVPDDPSVMDGRTRP